MQRAGQELISFFVAFRLRIARLEQATKLYPGKNQGGISKFFRDQTVTGGSLLLHSLTLVRIGYKSRFNFHTHFCF